ncbi:phage/plasmid primase, P4 family [Romboutsia sp. 1001713B170207_170306_H8]|uniref:phage/plasmid primase, P4 family n=1 Tax=Romboutsia sp. 1001713B170207_170306_H8 TaxID=2787112 RepID=UPI00189760C9|nr:phage/plasmid primase, P4 family [Romboutsia sp. 1001713B170207_170306_H8]
MFKGYIPTNGKRPTEEYKNRTEFYNLSDVEKLNSYGAVLSDEIIQIDIDDEEQSEIVFDIIQEQNIQCNILKTSRGKHFYFLNTNMDRRKQGYVTAIGVKVDTGLGTQNAVIPLKVDGKLRKWIKEVDTLDYLPCWLIPLDKKNIDFSKMEEGDGRNQTLFNYILRLQSAGLSKKEIKESIKIINNYVLREPLAENEINTILRDEAFLKESFYIKNKLQYEKLARYLIDNENIVKINDQLHIYKDGYYSNNLLDIEKTMLKYIQNSTKTPRGEVIRYLELLCSNKKITNPKYIVFNNGVYDLETKELLEYSPKYIIKNKIPHNYNPDAYHELLDKTLSKICCNDKKLRYVIEEMIGYTLLRRNELGKSFILTGDGSNGKSTLLDLINELLGEDNISSVSLKELSDRFKTFQLDGKLANIGDDISNEYIQDNSTFKKLVTGEKVNVERKGRDPYDFKNYSKLIFSANELPRINDLSGGLKRRLVFIPFNAKFSKRDEDYDPFIKDKITTPAALEYLLKIAIDGLYRIINNNSITSSEVCDKVWEEYEAINNPVVSFIEEHKIENESVNDVFRQYQVWCVESGLKPLSKIVFGKEVRKQGFNSNKSVKIEGKATKIYTLS